RTLETLRPELPPAGPPRRGAETTRRERTVRARAAERVGPHDRLLVGGRGPQLLSRLRGEHAEDHPTGHRRLREEVHQRQALRRRRAALAGGAEAVAADTATTSAVEGRPMNRRLLALLALGAS